MITEDDNINRGGKVYPTGVHVFSTCVFDLFEINLLKLELSLCTSWWHIDQWRYSSIHCLAWYLVEVGSQLQPLGETLPPYPLNRRLSGQQSWSEHFGEENTCRELNCSASVIQLVA